jgi:hypothetical protein
MVAAITREQALAWRTRRQLLNPPSTLSAAKVVARLCGVQAQVASSAELAVRVRRERSRSGDVERALAQGRLVKTWAMRGTLHLLAPGNGGAFLSVTAPERVWESWQRYFGTTSRQMEALWRAICEVLQAGDPLTRAELADAVCARRGLRFADGALRSSYGEILRPLAWRAKVCFGPSRDGRVTFTAPRSLDLLDADEAAPLVIASYLRAYGPATFDNLAAWLGNAVDKRRLRAWFAGFGGRLAEVEVDGAPMVVLARDLDELLATEPAGEVRLVPGFDQYVLGPGTKDTFVVPAARRSAVSRQAGWISPVVLVDGLIRGTWKLDGDEVQIAWFRECGRPPRKAIAAEVSRLSAIVGRDLTNRVDRAF